MGAAGVGCLNARRTVCVVPQRRRLVSCGAATLDVVGALLVTALVASIVGWRVAANKCNRGTAAAGCTNSGSWKGKLDHYRSDAVGGNIAEYVWTWPSRLSANCSNWLA